VSASSIVRIILPTGCRRLSTPRPRRASRPGLMGHNPRNQVARREHRREPRTPAARVP
jgi:hypothetical protein